MHLQLLLKVWWQLQVVIIYFILSFFFIFNLFSIGGTPISVDDVIISKGNLSMSDIYNKYLTVIVIVFVLLSFDITRYNVPVSTSLDFYYQSEPAAGYYCLYAKRPNETGWGVPDCANIPIIK